MERQGEEIHVTANEARGGETPSIVRYVLMVSLALAIVALSVIWISGAMTTAGPPSPDAIASEEAQG